MTYNNASAVSTVFKVPIHYQAKSGKANYFINQISFKTTSVLHFTLKDESTYWKISVTFY